MSRHPEFYGEGAFHARLAMDHLNHEADRAVRQYDQLMQGVIRSIDDAGQGPSSGAILADFMDDYEKWRLTQDAKDDTLSI